jgi:hypothetical protein
MRWATSDEAAAHPVPVRGRGQRRLHRHPGGHRRRRQRRRLRQADGRARHGHDPQPGQVAGPTRSPRGTLHQRAAVPPQRVPGRDRPAGGLPPARKCPYSRVWKTLTAAGSGWGHRFRSATTLGEQALAEARPLPAAYLFGMAEFFLPAEDPRKRTGPAGRSRPRPTQADAGGPVRDRLAAPDHRPRAAARAQPPTAELAAMLVTARLVPLAWQGVYDLGPIWLVRAVVAACS